MGQDHCASLHTIPEVLLTAVCDGYADNARKTGERFQVPFFTDHRELIASGLCDAVLVATPHPVRPPIARDVMNAGLHLLSEKPLAECVSAADLMVKTARKRKVAFGVMFQRRSSPPVLKALAWIRSGALGTVCRTTLIAPEFRPQAYYNSGAWRGTWKGEGGGVMINQAPHWLDLLILFGGMPCEVFGRCATRLHQMETEDLAEAMLTYPDGGTGYFYTTTNEPGSGHMVEVFGTKGKLCLRDDTLTLQQFSVPVPDFAAHSPLPFGTPDCAKEAPFESKADWGHPDIIRNFARHLLQGEPLMSPGEEGLLSLELANAVSLSAHRGKPVKLPLNRRAYDDFLEAKRKG
jgi:predicted dehydrogenase